MRFIRVLFLGSFVALVAAASPANAAFSRHCGSARLPYGPSTALHAIRVTGWGFSCPTLRQAARTYIGAPWGSVRSASCGQSGIGRHRHRGVECVRKRAHVSCLVTVGSRHGAVSFVLPGTATDSTSADAFGLRFGLGSPSYQSGSESPECPVSGAAGVMRVVSVPFG
jgi:hypothetical protein